MREAAGSVQMADEGVVPMKPANPGGGKALWSQDKRNKAARTAKIDGNIYELRPAKSGTVQKLQSALLAKARTEPGCRFYSLWDKVWREDVLREAFERCRRKAGAAGTDGESFERIKNMGVDQWLGKLREELREGRYQAQPLLRVWIPKSGGGERPLGIPTVRDRAVQMAMVLVLVIAPIFEADLCEEQMGFRPGRDAKTALRLVYYQVRQKGRQEVVDADLSKELKDLFAGCKTGLVFVTAFESRRAMQSFVSHIAWDSEVWILEDPDHMSHFNGERFLGQHPDVMPQA